MAKLRATFAFSLFLIFLIDRNDCAPRSKNSNGKPSFPQIVYDQKQVGSYNLRFHLKDFQVVAVVPDEPLLGDYDYSYDYSDFTVKPSSTFKPPHSLSPVTTTPLTPFTTSSSSPTPQTTSTTPASQPAFNQSSTTTTTTVKPVISSTEVHKDEINTVEFNSSSSAEKIQKFDDPGKIKVQIIETPLHGLKTPLEGVPGEEVQSNDAAPQGEGVPARKCGAGFTRDKRGRCRRVRKPGNASSQLFGLSRLASTLATKFKNFGPEESSSLGSLSSAESIEV